MPVMRKETSTLRYVIDEISREHFIQEHYFVHVAKGLVILYDGSKYLELKPGQCCIARKNRLGRYYKMKENNELEKTIFALDEAFLKRFQEKHKTKITKFKSTETFIQIDKNDLLPDYIRSLSPYYNRGPISAAFADVKREELLIMLLQTQPELAGFLFDFGIPSKVNMEEFMVRNYKFNVSVDRLAFLTGRSLSAFKRDFKLTFQETPNRWLVQKRLQEAHFLIEKQHKKPSEIYLELGFETLSHFSVAFKKQFRLTPTDLSNRSAKTRARA
jgi:AraC family transcriptional regulator, exoenzyme S synthesis regulatory protein ExsA